MSSEEINIFHHPYFRFIWGWSHPLFKLIVIIPSFCVGLYFIIEFPNSLKFGSIPFFAFSLMVYGLLRKQSKAAEFVLLLENGIYGKTYTGTEIFINWKDIANIEEHVDFWWGINLVEIQGKTEQLYISRHIERFEDLIQKINERKR